MKYRLRYSVEAVQVPGDEEVIGEEAFMTGHGHVVGWLSAHEFDFKVTDALGYLLMSETLGYFHALPGEWLVLFPDGVLQSMADDLFKKIYEEVPE